EVAVQLRHLRLPDLQAPAAGGVDQLPRLAARRVLEGRSAGAALDRLRRLARPGDLVHLGGDGVAVALRALKQRLREDHVVTDRTMAIAVAHVGIAEGAQVSLAIDAARLDQPVFRLAAIG